MSPLGGSPIPCILLLGAVLLGGTTVTYSYDGRSGLGWRVLEGVCVALAALGLIGFVISMRFGLEPFTVALSAALIVSPAALLRVERYRLAFRRDIVQGTRNLAAAALPRSPRAFVVFVVSVGGLLLLWRVATRTMFTTSAGVYTGVSHNIGDLPFHLSITSRFLYGQNFPPEHPSFAGASLTYPFLTDFLGAIFVRAGLPEQNAIVWSTFLLCAAFAALLYRFTRALTGSRSAAILAPALALMNGGFGWWRFVTETGQSAAGFWSFIRTLPHDYTITADNTYRWGNLVTSLLATQRGLLLGAPLSLIVLLHVWRAAFQRDEERQARSRRMLAAGVITGLLPLVHAHTFGVLISVAIWFAIFSKERTLWIPFFAWALALGVPQVLWMSQSGNIHGAAFFSWAPGWDHGSQNIVVFWLKNTGLCLPLLFVALAWQGERPLIPRAVLRFYLPFTLLFLVSNLFRFAPWVWDNIKILVYWFVASVPLLALVIVRLAEGRAWRRALAALVLVSLTLAGALDLWRVASGAFESRIFDRGGLAFAELVSEKTTPDSLILHAPVVNHPVLLTGRRSFMGYPGHVWSHGLDYAPREEEIRRIYMGSTDAAKLLSERHIDYIVVGPLERASTPLNTVFLGRYPLVAETSGYRLYRVAEAQGRVWR